MGELTNSLAALDGLTIEYNVLHLNPTRDEAAEKRYAELPALIAAASDRYIKARDAAEQNPEPAVPMDAEQPEVREINRLYHESRMMNFINRIADGQEPDGAEAEFRAAIFGKPENHNWNTIPIHFLLNPDEHYEVRADAATTIAASDGMVTTREILPRIFARTDAAFMGARFDAVSGGDQRYPRMSAGASLIYGNEGQQIDAAVGTITAADVTPRGASLAYLIGLESQRRFAPMVVENALRRDMAMAVTDGIDTTVIAGRPTTASNPAFVGINGLYGSLTAGTDATATVNTVSIFRAQLARVDGLHANGVGDVRALMRSEPYAVGFGDLLSRQNGEQANAVLMRSRATQRLAAPSGGLSQGILYAGAADPGYLVVPTWPGIDVFSAYVMDGGTRQLRLTLAVVHNVHVIDTAPWTRISFKDS